MPPNPSIPDAESVSAYIEDGARIAGILLVWSVIAAFFRYGVTELSLPFEALWLHLGSLFAVTGVLNAVLYLCYRAIDYWHEVN